MPDAADFCDGWQQILEEWEQAEDEALEAWDALTAASTKLEKAYWSEGKALIKLDIHGLVSGAAVAVARAIGLAIAAAKWGYDAGDKADTIGGLDSAFRKAGEEYNKAYAEWAAKKAAAEKAYEDLCDCESGD